MPESNRRYTFLIDTNLDLTSTTPGWPETFARLRIDAEDTTDLKYMDAQLEKQVPDFAFMPSGDYHRLQRAGKCAYRGLAIPTSKVTRQAAVPSVLVVKPDDPAQSLMDLSGSHIWIHQRVLHVLLLRRRGNARPTKRRPARISSSTEDATLARPD
ncbi:hypothetical protein M409DRAFT_18449 [Zasmidium cellare ATCC 36951]|uniref:Uncharacterized protein n=1 Tax=Zasmidium cellare ATCC 36951 TaxID=1080233 RepID=A0A6A6CW19_ZASCE|nr:uncharacterized protein M409DRAFT_18449 [Zasmidium cellare ATCC 36951]KAF2171334.1 hypothetical protein M409DRAFT_18449 [Zasmidium cellare ATCC 36951]